MLAAVGGGLFRGMFDGGNGTDDDDIFFLNFHSENVVRDCYTSV